MSYLALLDGVPDFTKAVISLWFRVPQSSIDAAAAGDRFAPHLPVIIPLITFSQPSDAVDMEPTEINIGTAVNFPQSECPYVASISSYHQVGPFPLDPCFIGINCDPDRSSAGHGKPTLVFNLQASGTAVILNYSVAVQNMAVYSLLAMPPPTVGDPNVPGNGWNDLGFPFIGFASNLVDFSDYLKAVPENFLVRSPVVIAADQWHHLLLSFDLSNPCITHGPPLDSGRYVTTAEGTTSWCRLWYAIDDINYDGVDNLQPFYVDGGSDPNAILTSNAWQVVNSETLYVYNLPSDPATCTYAPVPLPTSGVAAGLPASAAYVDNIHRIEMAEFQMFTGVALDTSVEENRRLFITKKDKNGNQFPINKAPIIIPISEQAVGDPTTWEDGADASAFVSRPFDPSSVPSTVVLTPGGRPTTAAIDFTKCSFNWMMGRNLGTLKGKFVRTGKIKAYFPDPKLGGQ